MDELEQKVDEMIALWLEEPYEGSSVEDRKKFSVKLTAFIKNELTKE